MPVYELSGKLLLTPTTARTGGTLVEGVLEDLEDAITLLVPFVGEYCRTGLGAKGGIETRQGHELPITLLLPFKSRTAVAQARTLIFNHLTTNGTSLQPWGTGATPPHASPPSFAAIVRPSDAAVTADANALHAYSPRWRMAEVADLSLIYSQSMPHIEGNFLPLVANQAHGGTTVPWKMGGYAVVNTAYGWTEPS